MPRHKHGHPHVLPVHTEHGGAHTTPERPPPRPTSRLVVLLAVASGLLVAAAIVGRLTAGGPDTGPDEPAGPTVASRDAARDAARDLRECRASWLAMRRVLAAAEPSMDQWVRHVGVMNRLVAGRLTLDQASQFWAQTRVASRQRYDAFAARDRSLRRSGAERGCVSRQGSVSASAPLADCERAVAAEAGTLAIARTTLARWSRHIVAMNQLRSGMLSPAMAQQMWQATWRRAVAELHEYGRREHHASTLHCGG